MRDLNKKDVVDAVMTVVVVFVITGVIRLWYGAPLDTSWARDAAIISVAVIGFSQGFKSGWRWKGKKKEKKEHEKKEWE